MVININQPAFWCFIGTKCIHGAEEAQHTNQLQLTQAQSYYCGQTAKKQLRWLWSCVISKDRAE